MKNAKKLLAEKAASPEVSEAVMSTRLMAAYRAERHAQHISARTGNATWLRADEVICASAEVTEATGVEIVPA